MASRVQPVNLVNFTGGLNLRADAFELGEGESPELMNVVVDPRGGFRTRKGWTKANTNAIGGTIGGTWDPRTLYVHEMANGTYNLYLAGSSVLLTSTDGGATWTDRSPLVGSADPHNIDFAAWGDVVYGVVGHDTYDTRRFNSATSATTITSSGGWSTYDSPVTNFPRSNLIASHLGYMFVASTLESAVAYPNRVRWSHPNNPEAWHADDYIDILDGGGKITAIMGMRDHLLIFKESSVWALFGYDSDSWQLVNVAREIGAPNRQCVARSESTVFFYSKGKGVFSIEGDNYPRELSVSLRPMFESSNFNTALPDEVWLGWIDQRLWWSVPWDPVVLPTTAKTTFVFDPATGGGSWVAFQAADGNGIGPFAQGGHGSSGTKLAAHRTVDSVLKLEADDNAVDDINGTPAGFSSYYVTKWVDGGMPTLKKSWRRPDMVVKDRNQGYTLNVDVYHDYDEASVVRTHVVDVGAGATGAIWGSFTWNDGTIWGEAAKGSKIERGGNLGTARAVQLRITGEVSKPWGVDAIVMKMIPRRFK